VREKPRSARTPHLRRLAEAFGDAIQAMSDDELRAVRREARRLSGTNCWWLVFRLGPLAAEQADAVLKTRQRAARRGEPV
jgi:hypothetical protein